jgi:hypothetical protein
VLYTKPSDILTNLISLIGEYREIETKKLKENPFYNFYLARLYTTISDIDPKYFYDKEKKEFKKKDKYEKLYDSAYYYSNKMIELQKDNIMGYYLLAYTLFYDKIRYESNDKDIFPFYGKRNFSNFKNFENVINNIGDRIYSIDTSNNNAMARIIDEISLWNRYINLININKELSINNLNSFQDSELNDILAFSNNYSRLNKYDGYLFISNKNKNNFSDLSSFKNESERILKERHFWDNVTADVYSNGNCNKIWIYSNGRYTQELYEQDISRLPYHEMMNISNYDLINCSVKNLPLLIKHSSNGKWIKEGSTYYFYPDTPAQYIIAGTDDKNRKYMYINKFGNLEHLRDDFQTVVLTQIAINCKECVRRN